MTSELAPGLRVVRRGPGHLQVGSVPGHRVVLPRTPEVLAALDRLRDRAPATPQDAAVLARLEAAGCLVEVRPPRPRGAVAVTGHLGIDHAPMLRAVGLEAVARGEGAVELVLSHGELDRAALDPLVRRGADHLVVRLVDGGVTIGPFVVPGATACLRCLDAHELVLDPHHVEVTTRYVRATAMPRTDGVPDLAEPALAHLALAWALRDVLAHADGRRPATWSCTVRLGTPPGPAVLTRWARHPDCGCSWPGREGPSGKMEA